MLILAGVVISLTIGENGIFNVAKYAVAKTEEEKAREKLELALADLQARKYTDENYDEDKYIDNYLSKESMTVIGNVVTVDGWKFSIDRSVPKIGESLGQGEESKKIKIAATVENASDYTKATINIEIEYEGTIKEIKINGEQVETIPAKNEEGKYILTKEVDKNGKYTIYVKDENDEYKTTIANVTEISEDMEIKNAQDLVYFRNRVNKGATYVGRTINVVNNIDLSKVCYKVDGTVANDVSWEPIGTWNDEDKEKGRDQSQVFKGTFNGNYHTIDNLYINSDQNYQGLFGYVENATITGVIIGKNSTIIGNDSVGGIAGYIYYTNISNCGNNANITGESSTGGIVGVSDGKTNSIIGSYNKGKIIGGQNGNFGGIAGYTKGSIKYCYNANDIESSSGLCGGICGTLDEDSIISNCYNLKMVSADGSLPYDYSETGGIVGIGDKRMEIKFCYNLGSVSGTSAATGRVGGISGNCGCFDGNSGTESKNNASKISYSYNSGAVSTSSIMVGGISGQLGTYCSSNDCYVLDTAVIKVNSKIAGNTTSDYYGSSKNSYLGKVIGSKSGTTTDVGTLNSSDMPTVYEVVNADEENGLNNGDSEYWSKTLYSDEKLQTPQLKWESNVK